MARCKQCGRTGFLLRLGPQGRCNACDREIWGEIEGAREKVKQELVSVRCLKAPVDRLRHLDRAVESTKVLVRYERIGYGGVDPSPSSLLGALERRREELTAEAGGSPTGVAGGGLQRGDRRRSRRRPAHLLARLDPGGVPAVVDDISREGLCLRSRGFRTPGSRVLLTLQGPAGSVLAQGIVRWARRAAPVSAGAGRAELGLEFLDVSPGVLALFKGAVRAPETD